MSSPTIHPRHCRCGTEFQHRVVDVLSHPVLNTRGDLVGLGTGDRLNMIPKCEGRWYWCWDCDTVRGNR